MSVCNWECEVTAVLQRACLALSGLVLQMQVFQMLCLHYNDFILAVFISYLLSLSHFTVYLCWYEESEFHSFMQDHEKPHIFTFANIDIDSASIYVKRGIPTSPGDGISHHQPPPLNREFSNSSLQSSLQYFSAISANQHISMESRSHQMDFK